MAINLFGLSIPQISLPSLPKISLPKVTLPTPPKIEIPKIKVPEIKIPEIKIPEVPKVTVPKITLPDIPKVDIPKISTIPGFGAVAGVAGVVADTVVGGSLPKIDLPKISLPTPPKIEIPEIKVPESKPALVQPGGGSGGSGGVWVPAGYGSGNVSLDPPPGGNIIDTVIGARDQSYEAGLTRAFSGNVAGGGTQVVATAAVDMLLPLDAVDVANKLATGRGGEVTAEDWLYAAIDTLGVAGSVFTLGGSYAASRALKAGLKGGKVAIKTNVIGKAIRSARGVGSSALSKSKNVLTQTFKVPTPTKLPDPGDASRILRETQAAQAKLTSQIADLRKSLTKVDVPKAVDLPSQLPNRLSKTGSTLTGAMLGAGGTAIALQLSGALGGAAPPPEEQEGGGGNGNGGLPGGDQSGGAGDDWWSQFIKSLYGGETYDPSLYDPYSGYTEAAYPDIFGWDPYAQDLLSYAEEIPVVGGVATAAKQSGFALPAIIGVVVLVIVGVAFFRSKKGKAMVSDTKKKVFGAAKSAKKAVGA